jgi:hypothetical protein
MALMGEVVENEVAASSFDRSRITGIAEVTQPRRSLPFHPGMLLSGYSITRLARARSAPFPAHEDEQIRHLMPARRQERHKLVIEGRRSHHTETDGVGP